MRRRSGNGAGPRVLGSDEDLRTAVFNVLDNAIKYSGEHVDVRVRLNMPDEKRIVLSVQDHGVGIPCRRYEEHLQALLPRHVTARWRT
jgi:two-component system, OmpR family, sensor histidine kinase ArlS